jgi:ATP/ADP translocase
MHRTIGFISKRFVNVRPGEGRKVLLTFFFFFLIITSYYLIKPVSRSLVLGELGSRMVPYIDLVVALVMGPIVALFARLVDRLPKPRLVTYSFWAVTAVIVVFWKLLGYSWEWVAAGFYIWVAIFSVLVVTLFWLVANDIYRPRDAKRLFGFIGSGGILGGIVGSSIAAAGAHVIGTENLLLLSAALLVLCWIVVEQMWQFAPGRGLEEHAPAAHKPRASMLGNVGALTKQLFSSRYLLLLVAMVLLNKLIATLIYYQLNPFIEAQFPDQDAKTSFNGLFFGGMNAIAFVVQFFFTSWVLRRWGLLVALLALPVGLSFGVVGLMIMPAFWLAAATEMYDGSLNYSLQQTTKELLYLPIDRSIRYKVKPFIDMVVFRFGKGFAAIIGIVLMDGLHWPGQALSYLVAPLLACWIAACIWLRRDYVMRIRTMLQARAASLRRPGLGLAPEEPALFGTLTDAQPPARKLALIDRMIGAHEPLAIHGRELIAKLTAYETHLGDELDQQAHRLKALISNQSEIMSRRRHAIRLLVRSGDQAAVDYLFGIATVEEDCVLRHEAVRGLVKLRLRHKHLEFPINAIRRQVTYEVANYQRIVHVAEIYRHHTNGRLAAEDPVVALLRELLEESVQQIFRLLMLLYRPEDIHLIYEQLRSADQYLRADALELLDNVIDPAMRQTIFPILDENKFLSVVEEGSGEPVEPALAFRFLQSAIWDHNYWLSVTALCAVGRLRLPTMRQELEKASRHNAPLISTAAKVALHMATLP